MPSSSGENLLSPELAVSDIDAFPDEEIDFAVDASGLLAEAQVIDDLQIFPSVFDSGTGKASIVGGHLDEDAEALTVFNVIAAEPNARLTLAQARNVAHQSVRIYRQAVDFH